MQPIITLQLYIPWMFSYVSSILSENANIPNYTIFHTWRFYRHNPLREPPCPSIAVILTPLGEPLALPLQFDFYGRFFPNDGLKSKDRF